MDKDQKTINAQWSKSAENYNKIIHDELASFRVAGWQRLIAAQVGDRQGLKVLDCGCGPAFFTIILAKAGYRVTGIDAEERLPKRSADTRSLSSDIPTDFASCLTM